MILPMRVFWFESGSTQGAYIPFSFLFQDHNEKSQQAGDIFFFFTFYLFPLPIQLTERINIFRNPDFPPHTRGE